MPSRTAEENRCNLPRSASDRLMCVPLAFSVSHGFSLKSRSLGPRMSGNQGLSKVKVCGVASREDALLIGKLARQELPSSVHLLLGMILWPNSKRSVPRGLAKEIADAARTFDADPVAVFVDERSSDIQTCCKACNVTIAQLHGAQCRQSVEEMGLPESLQWINVVDVSRQGPLETETRGAPKANSPPIWTLYDAPGGGSGLPFDWSAFTPPESPWLLAGGLDPDNVSTAVSMLHPTGVDVASGVTKADKVSKDPEKLRLFFREIAAFS